MKYFSLKLPSPDLNLVLSKWPKQFNLVIRENSDIPKHLGLLAIKKTITPKGYVALSPSTKHDVISDLGTNIEVA